MTELTPQATVSQGTYDATPWPADALETLAQCPVCGGTDTSVYYDDAKDNTFFTVPGTWTYHRCQRCGSAFLNPRPTEDSIHRAYASYYTHTRSDTRTESYAELSPVRRLRRRLANGYLNWRYGCDRRPASALGIPVALTSPGYRRRLDLSHRWLPSSPGTLLDVGCGNGGFLQLARQCGWKVSGTEPDPTAAARVRSMGIEIISGGLHAAVKKNLKFDVITMNHVIEHVHRPVETLRLCAQALVPGGRLWIQTPNFSSLGRQYFETNWRGLEAPRHLVLFTDSSLRAALTAAGFAPVRRLRTPPVLPLMTHYSQRLRLGLPYKGTANFSPLERSLMALGVAVEEILPSVREFLTFEAHRHS